MEHLLCFYGCLYYCAGSSKAKNHAAPTGLACTQSMIPEYEPQTRPYNHRWGERRRCASKPSRRVRSVYLEGQTSAIVAVGRNNSPRLPADLAEKPKKARLILRQWTAHRKNSAFLPATLRMTVSPRLPKIAEFLVMPTPLHPRAPTGQYALLGQTGSPPSRAFLQ